ncbi:MAG: phytanoyl-CoA dioxygenase family protein [Lentisphaeria bacterium]|nr:phytanoyl-CoA dioxygenase family protein [Lentisphaeria bacterium]
MIEALFEQSEVGEMSAAIERLKTEADSLDQTCIHKGSMFVITEKDGQKQIRRVSWAAPAEPELKKWGQDKRLTGVAKDLLGSDTANQLINQVHFKYPHDGVRYPFHQDCKHRGIGTDAWTDINGKGSYVQSLTAIDEATIDNGPMYFIPYSCKDGNLELELGYNDEADTDLSVHDLAEPVPILMKPGDVAFFGPYTIHGSFPNTSESPRRVFINGYAYPGANTRNYPGEGSGELITL